MTATDLWAAVAEARLPGSITDRAAATATSTRSPDAPARSGGTRSRRGKRQRRGGRGARRKRSGRRARSPGCRARWRHRLGGAGIDERLLDQLGDLAAVDRLVLEQRLGDQVEAAAVLVSSSVRPLLLAGGGCGRSPRRAAWRCRRCTRGREYIRSSPRNTCCWLLPRHRPDARRSCPTRAPSGGRCWWPARGRWRRRELRWPNTIFSATRPPIALQIVSSKYSFE